MAKNILIVPSRGQQATKQPYIYFTDTSDDIQEWKVGTGATITLIAIVDDPVFAERVIVAPVPTFHSWVSSEVSVK